MRTRRVHRLLAAVAASALLTPGPAVAAPRAPGLVPTPDSAEAGLWDLSEKAEKHARRSAELNANPALNAYVREVACKVSSGYCGDLRVYVLDRPFFNATMAPNGYTEVWSGLLLRCEDEAELAFVLGHEASHFVESHSLQAHNARKNGANLALALTIGVAVVGAVAAAGAPDYQSAQSIVDSTGNLIDVIYLASVTSLFRFTREQESEADTLGLQRAADAGYRATAGADSWKALTGETDASDFERIRKQDTRLGIFDTHPLTSARIEVLEKAAVRLGPAGEAGRERYRTTIRPFLSAWLKDDLRRRDYGETLHILDRLGRGGEDLGVVNFYRGEAYRLRNKDGDLWRSRDAYKAAADHPDAPVTVWRELGEAQRRAGDPSGARSALETYLVRAPEAEDSWMVRETINSLSKGT